MNDRDKVWEMLDHCVMLFAPVKEDYHDISRKPHQYYDVFWAKNEELRGALDELLVFMKENFGVKVINDEDMLNFRDEAKELTKSVFKTIDDYKTYKISDEIFPILCTKAAIYNYALPIVSSSEWPAFARKYVEFMI